MMTKIEKPQAYVVRYYTKHLRIEKVRALNVYEAFDAATSSAWDDCDYVDLVSIEENGSGDRRQVQAECVYCGRPIFDGEIVYRDANDEPNCSMECRDNVRLAEGEKYRGYRLRAKDNG
jgi:hypothetical protein